MLVNDDPSICSTTICMLLELTLELVALGELSRPLVVGFCYVVSQVSLLSSIRWQLSSGPMQS